MGWTPWGQEGVYWPYPLRLYTACPSCISFWRMLVRSCAIAKPSFPFRNAIAMSPDAVGSPGKLGLRQERSLVGNAMHTSQIGVRAAAKVLRLWEAWVWFSIDWIGKSSCNT